MNDFLQARRQITNRSIMQVAADVCAAASILFWNWVMWRLIEPQWPATMNDIPISLMSALLSIVMALCWALVLPVLCAAVFPNTAAGMLLQEYQRGAWGFMLMAVAAIFLFYQSYFIISIWWGSRVAVAESNLVMPFTIATMIFFVLVPAWTWHQSSPAQWIAEVQQAHAVRKLREAHKAELLMARAAYLRVVAVLRRGLDVATVAQRQDAAAVMTGLHLAQSDAIGEIAASLHELGATSWVGGDGLGDDYVKKLDRATHLLFKAQDAPDEFAHLDTDSYRPATLPTPAHQDGPNAHETARTEIIPDAPRASPDTIAYHNEYRIARHHFGRMPWKVSQLGPVLNIDQVTARKRMEAWRDTGLITGKGHSTGNYSFTE